MKLFKQIFAIIIVASLFFSENNFAQSNDQPLLVVSFQKVKMADVAAINKMINEKFAPILNGLVDD